jgi:hypothetical protein
MVQDWCVDLFARKDRGFDAPTVPEHHADLGPEGPCVLRDLSTGLV